MTKKKQANDASNARDEFSQSTRELLARRAGYRCSICKQPTVGPHSEPGRSIFLGEAAHICSAAPNGPRANISLTQEERSAASNGIHLCKVHAKLVDVDVNSFPVEKLNEIKASHEAEIRALSHGEQGDFEPEFLNSHETQVIHGRGTPKLSDLWVPRTVVQPQVGSTLIKRDPVSLMDTESGIVLISGEPASGRTSLLKRMVSNSLGQRNCVWLNGSELTESAIKDPVRPLAAGHRKINSDSENWNGFLQGTPSKNLIVIDDLHRSPLNIATKRKLLSLLQGLSALVVVTVIDPFILELLAISPNDGLRLSQWRLLELTRKDFAYMAERWCRFGSESTPDHELDHRIASTHDRLELVFGKKLVPRQPMFVLTTLQWIDAGTPMDSHVGSFGGVYETIIHFALCKNARNQADIGNERSYLQELAYYCESHSDSVNRQSFNLWFAEHKAITPKRASELEAAVLTKGFLSRHHQGFRFNYQKYYFLAAFLRDNPNRLGVRDYISRLVAQCWNEDYANTALFLAYLQPSSYLTEALLKEIRRLFVDQPEFKIADWQVPTPFPPGFFRGLQFRPILKQIVASSLNAWMRRLRSILLSARLQHKPHSLRMKTVFSWILSRVFMRLNC